MPNRLTQEQARHKIDAIPGYKFKDVTYRASRSNHWIEFPCGHVNFVRYNTVGTKGCLECTKNTHEEMVARGLERGAELLEPYRASNVKHRYRFVECGHEAEVKPNQVDHFGCGMCRHDPGLTYVYLMQRDNQLKIGITAVDQPRSNNRISQLKNQGWMFRHKVLIETREQAEAIEAAVIQSWRESGHPPALAKGVTGWTETVSSTHVSVSEIRDMMKNLALV